MVSLVIIVLMTVGLSLKKVIFSVIYKNITFSHIFTIKQLLASLSWRVWAEAPSSKERQCWARRLKTLRHTWLLEAVMEKLDKQNRHCTSIERPILLSNGKPLIV